jgi:DnaK suppressor protein
VSADSIAARHRPRIERELAELDELSRATEVDRAPVELDQQSVGRLTRMDAMQNQAMAEATDRRRQSQIARLRKALARMDEGEYGFCAECGEPIAPARLDIDPSYEQCVDCAGRG